MKPLLPCAAALLTLLAASGAHAQTSDSSLTAATAGVATPTLAEFAGETSAPSLALPDAAMLSSGLQLNRTNGQHPAWAKFASGTGNILFLGVGTLLPLVEDGKDGQQHALRTADALIVSTLFSEGIKRIVREKRPDSEARTSFPSGHVTAAFAVATMESHYHPKQAILWYAGATAIAASRVKLHRHYTHDVIAGAALGFVTARWELHQNRGLLLRPFIHEAQPGNRVTGMSFSKSF